MLKTLLLIVNVYAGKQEIRSSLWAIIDKAVSSGYLPHVVITQEIGHATQVVLEIGEKYDLIVCVGGDGTFNETINGVAFLEKDVLLGYIPSGSVNDLARSLGFTTNSLEMLERIFTGSAHHFDLGKLNDRFFAYVAAIGAFTSVSHQTPQNLKNIFGRFAYYLEGLKSLSDLRHSYHLCIDVDGEIFEDEYIFLAISNSYFLGGVMPLDSKNISFSDGEFELILIKAPKNPVELQKILFSLRFKQYDDQLIHFVHGKKFKIISNEELEWVVDGESAGKHKVVDINVYKNKINLMY